MLNQFPSPVFSGQPSGVYYEMFPKIHPQKIYQYTLDWDSLSLISSHNLFPKSHFQFQSRSPQNFPDKWIIALYQSMRFSSDKRSCIECYTRKETNGIACLLAALWKLEAVRNSMKMHIMLSQEDCQRILPSCSETRKSRACRKRKMAEYERGSSLLENITSYQWSTTGIWSRGSE